MNKLSPEQESANDQLCRDIFAAASASQEQMDAAADAPFLYQRIRNEIAQHAAMVSPISIRTFFSSLIDWRWGCAAMALLLLSVGLWQLSPQRQAIPVARPESPPTSASTAPIPRSEKTAALPTVASINPSALRIAPRTASARVRRLAAQRQRQEEVMTEFIPLTYVADSATSGGHLIRVEVTPTMLASLGFPVKPERQWVKADVVLGNDGLARAIRFVQ